MEILEFLLSLLEWGEIFWWIGRGLWKVVKGILWLVLILVQTIAAGPRALGRRLTRWSRRRRAAKDFATATAAQRGQRWR